MRRVTFSRNYTLSLSRTCQCYCKYCAFATHRAHIHEPDEVERRLDEAVRRNAKELLVLTGERPEVNPEVAERLREWGHEDFTSYVLWACQRALERGLLPHTNLGVLSREDLGRLREVTASQGLMLESINPDWWSTRDRRPSIRRGGWRPSAWPASCGSRSPPGSWSASARPRRSGSPPSRRLPRFTREWGHIQEVILQNFVPHPRYYGAEVADIADDRFEEERWESGRTVAPSFRSPTGRRPSPSTR